MLKSKFDDSHKTQPVDMAGHIFDGIPVKREVGMIYWYTWGKHTFDIRVVRRVLGLAEDHPADKWFMADKPDPRGSFAEIMQQLQEALGTRKFAGVIAEHDKLI